MKSNHVFLALSLMFLSACATTPHSEKHVSSKGDPETVLVNYYVKPGREGELQQLLSRAWDIYISERMVFDRPHVIVRENDANRKAHFIEIFTWVSHSAPEHAPDSVKAIWQQEQALCEARDGHNGLGGGEVELLVPAHH